MNKIDKSHFTEILKKIFLCRIAYNRLYFRNHYYSWNPYWNGCLHFFGSRPV